MFCCSQITGQQMYRRPPRPSPSARRKAPTWNLRFPSSTKVPRHTQAISSCSKEGVLGALDLELNVDVAARRVRVGTDLLMCVPGERRKLRLREALVLDH
jgi:hypothetical protein